MSALDNPALGLHDEPLATTWGHKGCWASCQVPVLRLPGWRTISTLMPWVCSMATAHLPP